MEGRVERLDQSGVEVEPREVEREILNEAAAGRVNGVGRAGSGVKRIGWTKNPAPLGNFSRGVNSVADVRPKAVEVGSAWKYAPNPNYGHAFLCVDHGDECGARSGKFLNSDTAVRLYSTKTSGSVPPRGGGLGWGALDRG